MFVDLVLQILFGMQQWCQHFNVQYVVANVILE